VTACCWNPGCLAQGLQGSKTYLGVVMVDRLQWLQSMLQFDASLQAWCTSREAYLRTVRILRITASFESSSSSGVVAVFHCVSCKCSLRCAYSLLTSRAGASRWGVVLTRLMTTRNNVYYVVCAMHGAQLRCLNANTTATHAVASYGCSLSCAISCHCQAHTSHSSTERG
jgi:hypothetical protein